MKIASKRLTMVTFDAWVWIKNMDTQINISLEMKWKEWKGSENTSVEVLQDVLYLLGA